MFRPAPREIPVPPEAFEPLQNGIKRFAFARGAEVGDVLRFVEVEEEGRRTGRALDARVTFVERSRCSDACCASLVVVRVGAMPAARAA